MIWRKSNICIKLFFFFLTVLVLQQLGLGHYDAQQVCVLVSSSRHVCNISTSSWLAEDWYWKDVSFSSQPQRKGGSKKDVSYLIYLITFSICQSSGAQNPNVFCEALWNLLDFKHVLKNFSKQGWLYVFDYSLACVLLNHMAAAISTFKVVQMSSPESHVFTCIYLNDIGGKVNKILGPDSKNMCIQFWVSCLDFAQP